MTNHLQSTLKSLQSQQSGAHLSQPETSEQLSARLRFDRDMDGRIKEIQRQIEKQQTEQTK